MILTTLSLIYFTLFLCPLSLVYTSVTHAVPPDDVSLLSQMRTSQFHILSKLIRCPSSATLPVNSLHCTLHKEGRKLPKIFCQIRPGSILHHHILLLSKSFLQLYFFPKIFSSAIFVFSLMFTLSSPSSLATTFLPKEFGMSADSLEQRHIKELLSPGCLHYRETTSHREKLVL